MCIIVYVLYVLKQPEINESHSDSLILVILWLSLYKHRNINCVGQSVALEVDPSKENVGPEAKS